MVERLTLRSEETTVFSLRRDHGLLVHARATPTQFEGGVKPATLGIDDSEIRETRVCRFRADLAARARSRGTL
jgi:hypothetical protein